MENTILEIRDESPLLVSFPHSGTNIPQSIALTMSGVGRSVPDTDWFLPRLYDFDPVDRASQIRANFSRYVIDPNRPPDGANLYPGRPTPEICPRLTFDGREIYLPHTDVTSEEIQCRKRDYWQPYHDQLRHGLDQILARRGLAVLFDAHSIASRVPRLFEGKLPDINIGTFNSHSCTKELEAAICRCLESQNEFSFVINGRFVGGYITRSYGDPENHIHAVQLELSQATYMDETGASWDDERAARIQPCLKRVLETIDQWATSQN